MNALLQPRWLIAAALSSALAYQSFHVASLLAKKTQAQTAVVDAVSLWKRDLAAVGDVERQWQARYPAEGAIQDVLGLLEQVRSSAGQALSIDFDRAFVQRVEPVKHAGVELGLTKVCLGSAEGGEAFVVKAPSYDELMGGLRQLAAKPQINIGSVLIHGDKQMASATLGDLCVLVRK